MSCSGAFHRDRILPSSDGRLAISDRLKENDGAVTRVVRPDKPRCHQRPLEGLLPKISVATIKCFPSFALPIGRLASQARS